MNRPICALLAFLALFASPLAAQKPVALSSKVFVERSTAGSLTLEPAGPLLPGQKVVLVLAWTAPAGAAGTGKGFTLTTTVPETLQFRMASDERALVSADGGRTWGKLGSLRIAEGLASRLAAPEDVTHVRLRITPDQAARGTGRLSYSALVR